MGKRESLNNINGGNGNCGAKIKSKEHMRSQEKFIKKMVGDKELV